MFAEELGGNASRKRQQENRARRRQLKNEKQKQAVRATTNLGSASAAAAPTPNDATNTTISSNGVAVPKPAAPVSDPISAVDGTTPATPSNAKSAAVANALQQRQLRQANILQQKSSVKIQSFVRARLSHHRVLGHYQQQLSQQLQDLAKLRTLLQQNAPDKPFIVPQATATFFVRQLLFVTKNFTPGAKNCQIGLGWGRIKVRETDDTKKLQDVLDYTIIPGLVSPDDNSNPLLPWMESAEGRHRLRGLIRLCLLVATTKNTSLQCVGKIVEMLRLVLSVDKTRALSPKAQKAIVPVCQQLLIQPTRQIQEIATDESNTDLIDTLRKFLLFTIGGSQPIPSGSSTLREECISKQDRSHTDPLFQLVLDATQSIPQHRVQLQSRFLAMIFSIPLLSWKVTAASSAKILAGEATSKVLLVQFIESFTEVNKVPISNGNIADVLPNVQVPLTQCPATNTQCLLANLLAFGRLSPHLNGSDRSNLHFSDATIFFRLIAALIDVVPLGTFVSRDSAVAWIIDKKGTHTPIVLSPVILEQCKLLLVDSFVRNIFNIAIDSAGINTESILAAKNDKDLKQAADLKEAGGGSATATAMAAKEARNDKKRAWLSSKWASNLKKGVSSLLLSKGDAENHPTGKSALPETSAASLRMAKGGASTGQASSSNAKTINNVYNPALLLALCRVYATFIARYGGNGDMDIVAGRPSGGKELATARADPCTMTLLNVLCFGTDLLKASWAVIQSDKGISADIQSIGKTTQIRGLTARPSYTQHQSGEAAALLFVSLTLLSHSLIITDDVEIYEMDRPLPLHQIRRCILLLKQILCRACGETTGQKTNPFGLALVSASVKAMRSLYDRSARRPLCVPKLWLVDNLLVREIGNCQTHSDYVSILSNPVLRICPFLLAFKRRLKLFERIITTSRIEIQGVNDMNPFNPNPMKPGIPVQIMRGRVLEDGLATLNKLGRNLRQRINVQYINEAGVRESGIDAGGLFKEFWTDLCAVAFNPHYALFRVTEDNQNCLYPNPSSGAAHGPETHIILFEFLGRILGKALFEGITVHPQFSHFFLSFLRGDYNYLHMLPDLSSVDSQLYNNLMFLKNYDGDAVDLCLTFTVADDDFGGNKEVELIPNGRNMEVTNTNKQRYIGLIAKHIVVDRVKDQAEAFTRGLWDVIDKTWLRLFNEPELQVLISGATGGALDVDDMRANTKYIGGYTGIERTISRFWSVVASLSTKQQADLLRFVTSCERPPPLGFASLNPSFTIQRVGIMRDGDRLPTASTCFNVLKLPTYSNEKVMRQRLITAIESGAGFELA